MIKLWNKILYLCKPKISNSNVVFTNDNTLNNICLNRIKSNQQQYASSYIITHKNYECYELKIDKNGKQYKNKNILNNNQSNMIK